MLTHSQGVAISQLIYDVDAGDEGVSYKQFIDLRHTCVVLAAVVCVSSFSYTADS